MKYKISTRAGERDTNSGREQEPPFGERLKHLICHEHEQSSKQFDETLTKDK